MKILELKRHLNKPDESYLCDLLKRGRDFIIVKYVSDRPVRVGSVTFDAGLATQGFIPIVAIYSTFHQRAFDQVIHYVCLQELPVIFAIA